MRPLIYYTAFGAEQYFEQVNKSIKTLRKIGKYEGEIALLTDRDIEIDGVITINCIDFIDKHKDISKYNLYCNLKLSIIEKININEYDCILYLDGDVIINQDIHHTLHHMMNGKIVVQHDVARVDKNTMVEGRIEVTTSGADVLNSDHINYLHGHGFCAGIIGCSKDNYSLLKSWWNKNIIEGLSKDDQGNLHWAIAHEKLLDKIYYVEAYPFAEKHHHEQTFLHYWKNHVKDFDRKYYNLMKEVAPGTMQNIGNNRREENMNNMKYVGIHAGHDAGICIHNSNGEMIYYCSIERVTRKKHAHGLIHSNYNGFNEIIKIVGDSNFIILTDNIYEFNDSFIRYSETFKEKISLSIKDIFPKLQDVVMVSHHIAHTFASYMYRESDNDDYMFISLDGGGHYANTTATNSIFGSISNSEVRIIETDFATSTHCLNTLMGGWSAGKMMGMAGYFNDAPIKNIDLNKYPNVKEKKDSYTTNEYIEMAGFYKYVIKTIQQQIETVFNRNDVKNKGLCVSGGTHLALELNSWIYNNITQDIAFCPATDDSGICLGLSGFGYWKYENKMPNRIQSPFIQTYKSNENYSSLSVSDMAKELNNKQVYGVIRGNPECGPRALGHRSILASPTDKNMYQVVSVDLKGREFYRPIAPIVTDRAFDELFTGPKGKYMQYLTSCKDGVAKKCPAIVHEDGSSRPQVVSRESDPWMYDLLVEFGKLSGVECLINTSLNKNAPICNTFEDALSDFKGVDNIHIVNVKE